MTIRLEANESLRFTNGWFVFRNGVQIDPRSIEGSTIVSIIKQQEAVKKLNHDEKLKWIIATYPKDPSKQQEMRVRFGI